MFDLPIGFSLQDFMDCTDFATNMLLDKPMADFQNWDEFPEIIEDDYTESLTDYYSMAAKEGTSTAYYHTLMHQLESHESCQFSYRNIIADCECNSSIISELPYLLNDQGMKTNGIHIGSTAHEAAFLYIRSVYEHIGVYCLDSDQEPCTAKHIKSKLSEIQNISAWNSIEREDANRIVGRMNRENAIVLGRYSSKSKIETITSVAIRKIVAAAVGRDEIYTTSWVRSAKLAGKWPPAIKERNERKGCNGRTPDKWDFQVLKPYLEKQFPDVDWDNV